MLGSRTRKSVAGVSSPATDMGNPEARQHFRALPGSWARCLPLPSLRPPATASLSRCPEGTQHDARARPGDEGSEGRRGSHFMQSDLIHTGLCSLTQGFLGIQSYLESLFKTQALGPPPQPVGSEFLEGKPVTCGLNMRARRSAGLPKAILLALAEGPPAPEELRPTPRAAEGPGTSRGRTARRVHAQQRDGTGVGLRATRRQAEPPASHLHASDSELGQGSAHLGGSRGVVFAVGNDFDEQGVIMWRDDSPLECRRIIQADAHALSAPEHLWAEVSRVRNWVGSRIPDVAPGPAGHMWMWQGAGPSTKVPSLAREVLPYFSQ